MFLYRIFQPSNFHINEYISRKFSMISGIFWKSKFRKFFSEFSSTMKNVSTYFSHFKNFFDFGNFEMVLTGILRHFVATSMWLKISKIFESINYILRFTWNIIRVCCSRVVYLHMDTSKCKMLIGWVISEVATIKAREGWWLSLIHISEPTRPY